MLPPRRAVVDAEAGWAGDAERTLTRRPGVSNGSTEAAKFQVARQQFQTQRKSTPALPAVHLGLVDVSLGHCCPTDAGRERQQSPC